MSEGGAARIVALVPAFNEAARIGPVVAGARASLPVLVVDDGSTDETASVAASTGATVVRHVPNQGKGAALRRGMQWVLERDVDAAVTLDADGQHDPRDVPALLSRFREDRPDLIVGARDFSRIPLARRVANTVGRWSFSWALREPVLDNQSGFRLLSRRMMEATLDSDEDGFEFEVEMIVRCHQLGYRLAWVPIRTIYGSEPSHISGLAHAMRFARLVFQTRQATRVRSSPRP